MLHITNGHSVSLDQTGLPGRIIYWVDVLHEGPVPSGLSLHEMSDLRGRFLTEFFAEPVSFTERDEALQTFRDHEDVVLWFEHDLYDQLQLVQLLDWFSRQEPRHPRLSLICKDRYLGQLSAGQLNELFPERQQVSSAEYETAQAAWQAFTSNQPAGITQLLQRDTEALPFLRGALLRHLEQFPGRQDGLSRTERQALQLATAGLHGFVEMFLADQKLEELIFMGDTTYRRYLQRLREARHPLLQEFATNSSAGLQLTAFGRSVLAGEADHVTENDIDTWLGGVHLHDGAPVWRWDGARGTLAS